MYSGISRSQMRHGPLKARYVISNGIDEREFPYNPSPKRPDLPFDGDYLVWMGKILPHKGTHLAIEAARISRLPLVILAGSKGQTSFCLLGTDSGQALGGRYVDPRMTG
jgi:glycosyltransferase involved in cell wall biosynthesis